MWESLTSWLYRGLVAGGCLVGAGLGLLFFFQEKLIYIPRLPGLPDDMMYYPNQFGLEYEDIDFTAQDGVKLHGWLMWPRNWTRQQRRQHPTVLFFQENAGNMSLRLPFLRLLVAHLNCSVFAPSYRGYGFSKGKPNQQGLQLDAAAALDWLSKHPDVNKQRIAVFGRSLGGAVTIHMAASNTDRIAAVIIENTFTSIEEVAPKVMPFLRPFLGPGRPFNWLVRNKWRNHEHIHKLRNTPVLMLSSLHDEMLPSQQMRQLRDMLQPSGNLTWVQFDHAGHMDAYETAAMEYWPAVSEFGRKHLHVTPVAEAADQDLAGIEEAEQALAQGVEPVAAAGPIAAGGQGQQAGVKGGSGSSLSDWATVSDQDDL